MPCGILNDYAAVMDDPHLRARDFIIEVDHPRAGRTRATGFPVRLSATPAQLQRPAPILGQHTAEILASLGLSDDEIDDLRQAGAI